MRLPGSISSMMRPPRFRKASNGVARSGTQTIASVRRQRQHQVRGLEHQQARRACAAAIAQELDLGAAGGDEGRPLWPLRLGRGQQLKLAGQPRAPLLQTVNDRLGLVAGQGR